MNRIEEGQPSEVTCEVPTAQEPGEEISEAIHVRSRRGGVLGQRNDLGIGEVARTGTSVSDRISAPGIPIAQGQGHRQG